MALKTILARLFLALGGENMALKITVLAAILLAFGVVGSMDYADRKAAEAYAQRHIVERPQDCRPPAVGTEKLIVYVTQPEDGAQVASCRIIPLDQRELDWLKERLAAHRELRS